MAVRFGPWRSLKTNWLTWEICMKKGSHKGSLWWYLMNKILIRWFVCFAWRFSLHYFLSFSDYFYKLFSVYNILNEGSLQTCCSPRNENLTLLVQIKFLNLFLYVSKKTNWKIYWPEQSFTGLKAEDRCSSWELVLVGKTVLIILQSIMIKFLYFHMYM